MRYAQPSPRLQIQRALDGLLPRFRWQRCSPKPTATVAGAMSAAAGGNQMVYLFLISSVCLVLIYQLLLPALGETRLSQMLLDRGPIQPITLGVAILGALAALRCLWQGRGERRRALTLMQTTWPEQPQPVAALRTWFERQAPAPGWGADRLRRMLDAAAAGEVVSSAAERLALADRGALRERYQFPRSLSGALPMLGLAGTVLGLSSGMGELTGIIGSADTFESLRQLLTGFSGSLASAFDTTLLALMLLAPLLVLLAIAQRRDEATLALVDACSERLIPLIERLNTDRPDEAMVQRASERLVVALERGLAEILPRAMPPARDALDSGALQALVALPPILEQVRAALAEPRAIEVRVAQPDDQNGEPA